MPKYIFKDGRWIPYNKVEKDGKKDGNKEKKTFCPSGKCSLNIKKNNENN